jgi:hypothetical protein
VTSTISCKQYVEYDKIIIVLDSMIKKISEFREIMSLDMYDLTKTDDAPDLTDIHPRDRENVKVLCGPLPFDGKPNLGRLLKEESDILINLKGYMAGFVFFMTPNSVLPLHIHGQYISNSTGEETDVYNACFGITVPSTDSKIVGIEVNGEVYCHGPKIDVTFDPQIPHQAWNHTNEWWTMLLLNIDKKFFI